MKKAILLLGFLFLAINLFSQDESLNEYKYVLVPSSFSFLKEADQYQLNSLTKFLFNKYGFQAILDTEKPHDDALTNNCLILKSNVLNNKALLKTKLIVELKNCKGEVVFTSKIGESREKEYKKAYHEALRDAFTSFESVNYSYQPKIKGSTDIVVLPKKEVVKQPKIEEAVAVKEKVTNSTVIQEKRNINAVLTLYAQPIQSGFQLVDTTPKVVYILLETNLKDVFIVKDENAILYKENGRWFLSYSETETSELSIKF